MKVLCHADDPSYIFHIRGLGNVFKGLGHDFTEWNMASKPAFDIFDEIEPDIYLGPQSLRPVVKCLGERRNRVKTKSLDAIPFAADTFDFLDGVFHEDMSSEVACIASYKPGIIDDAFREIGGKGICIKVCGPEPWPMQQYLGSISTHTMKHFYASSKACLNFDMSPEQVFQIYAAFSIPISCHVGGPFDTNSLLIAESPRMYADLVEAMCSPRNEKSRQGIIKEGRKVISSGHTYFHRVATLFEEWGMGDESKRTLKLYDATVEI